MRTPSSFCPCRNDQHREKGDQSRDEHDGQRAKAEPDHEHAANADILPTAQRLREAAKLGFERGYGPSELDGGSSKLKYGGLTQLANLGDRIMGGA